MQEISAEEASERSRQALLKLSNRTDDPPVEEKKPIAHDEACQNPAGHSVPDECLDADGKPLKS